MTQRKYARDITGRYSPPTHVCRCISRNLWDTTIAFQSHELVVPQENQFGKCWLVACELNKRYEAPASPTGYEAGFTPRYFVVKHLDGGFICSAQDAQVSASCIAKVLAFCKRDGAAAGTN